MKLHGIVETVAWIAFHAAGQIAFEIAHASAKHELQRPVDAADMGVEELRARRDGSRAPSSPEYTRAELNAALEGMRVTVTDEVTNDVIAKVSEFLLARSRELAPHDAADELETAALDLRDGEWRRPRPSESTSAARKGGS